MLLLYIASFIFFVATAAAYKCEWNEVAELDFFHAFRSGLDIAASNGRLAVAIGSQMRIKETNDTEFKVIVLPDTATSYTVGIGNDWYALGGGTLYRLNLPANTTTAVATDVNSFDVVDDLLATITGNSLRKNNVLIDAGDIRSWGNVLVADGRILATATVLIPTTTSTTSSSTTSTTSTTSSSTTSTTTTSSTSVAKARALGSGGQEIGVSVSFNPLNITKNVIINGGAIAESNGKLFIVGNETGITHTDMDFGNAKQIEDPLVTNIYFEKVLASKSWVFAVTPPSPIRTVYVAYHGHRGIGGFTKLPSPKITRGDTFELTIDRATNEIYGLVSAAVERPGQARFKLSTVACHSGAVANSFTVVGALVALYALMF